MRINKFLASSLGISRRKADDLLAIGRVFINDELAGTGSQVQADDVVRLDDNQLQLPKLHTTIMLNKPEGYVCSRDGQGSDTIYDLLPSKFHKLKTVGRLDKDSSGLLLLTDDGDLAHKLTHPSFKKDKVYEVELNKDLSESDKQQIESGVELEDGVSQLKLKGVGKKWTATMHEGRNRQIRRTFEALGYRVKHLNRRSFDDYQLKELNLGGYILL